MSAHSYIYVTIFYFLNYLFFKKKKIFFSLKMMLTYHISHEKFFPTALYVHGRLKRGFTLAIFSRSGKIPVNRHWLIIIVSGLDSSFPIALSSLFDISSLPDEFLFFNLLLISLV